MKLGVLAYATKTGLGYQTAAYVKYLKPDKVMLVDISRLNKQPVHTDWFNFDIRTDGIPTIAEIDSFLDNLDIILMAETPLNYYLIQEANRRGIKIILAVNPEFCDYFANPSLPKPTIFALPTLWLIDKFHPKLFPNVIHLPVPIDSQNLPKRTITEAKTFFHISGRLAIHDRNGTLDFIRAVKSIQDHIDARFIIYAQSLADDIKQALVGSRIDVKEADEPADLYKDGDVLIMPRKYGGLCLPAQEAIGCGIPVIMPDIDPNNRWIPKDWLVKVSGKFIFNTRLPIDAYTTDGKELANMMVLLNKLPANVAMKAKEARQMAEMMSWDKMAIRYQTLMQTLCMSASSV